MRSWPIAGGLVMVVLVTAGLIWYAAQLPPVPENLSQDMPESAVGAVVPSVAKTEWGQEQDVAPEKDTSATAAVPEGTKTSESLSDLVEALTGLAGETGQGAIEGGVFDAESGEGVAAAVIEAMPEGGGFLKESHPTDSSGRYRIEGLTAGVYHVTAAGAPGYIAVDWDHSEKATVVDGESTKGVDFLLQRGVSVRGRVLDRARRPVSGAEVQCIAGWFEKEVVESAEDGRFEFPHVPPYGTVFLAAHKGEASAGPVGPLTPTEVGVRDVVLILELSGSISGWVVDAQGRPVSGVYVVAEPVGHSGWESSQRQSSKTGERGEFALRNLCPSTYGLHVFDRQRSEGPHSHVLTTVDESLVAEIVTQAAAELSRTMGEADSAGALAELRERLKDIEEQWMEKPFDLSGTYLDGSALEQVSVAPGQAVTGIKLVLTQFTGAGWAVASSGRQIAGRVVCVHGNPVSGAHVELDGVQHRFTTSRSDGTFNFSGMPEGKYTVMASSKGFADSPEIGVVAGTTDIEVVLQPLVSVSGRVIEGRTRRPVPAFEIGCKPGYRTGDGIWATQVQNSIQEESGAQIRWDIHPAPPWDFVRVEDEQGRFKLDNIGWGTHTFFVRAEGYAVGFQTITDIVPGETVEGVVIELNRSASIAGRVVDAAGKPVPGAAIFLDVLPAAFSLGDFNEGEEAARAGADGAFVLDTVLPEMQRIWAWQVGYAPTAMSFSQRSRSLTIVLSRGGTLQGTVTLEGQPVRDAYVSVRERPLMETHESEMGAQFTFGAGRTGPDGRYAIGHLPPQKVWAHCSYDVVEGRRRLYVMEREALIAENQVTELNFELTDGRRYNVGGAF